METRLNIDILIPLFNEQESISNLVSTLESSLNDMPFNFSFIFVDDGSTDLTVSLLKQLPNWPTTIVELSRNFGKEIAVQSGIDTSVGDALILLDADLQDPISLIPKFIAHWEQGYEIVYGIRANRENDKLFQRLTSGYFYKIFLKMADVEFPPHATDARLMSKKVVNALKEVQESNRFNKGIFHSVGFKSIGVPFTREKRLYGKTSWNTKKLIKLAISAFLGFTTKPLHWATYLGSTIALGSISLGCFYTIRKIFFGVGPSGYTSLIVAILFLGAIQLISLGILGLYISQIVSETKKRPLYFVSELVKLNEKHHPKD